MGDRLIAEYDHVDSRYLFYTPDQINSTRVVTDQAGTVVYSAAHDPYGGIQQTWVNTFDPTPKFSGKERDAESGLDYFGARYYDRAQYRFISVDPETNPVGCAAQPQLWHLFGYCRNNPLAFVDPDGAASFALNRLTFLADSNSAVLKGNYGRSDVPDQILDIKITMDQTGKFSIDVKATGWVVLANPRDNIWARLDTLLSNYTENRVLLHEHRHLTYIEKYVLKKLEKLELTLNSDKVSTELQEKIWGWIDKAKDETRAAMDSVWGLVTWSETILYLSGKGI
jgi:RHS repeat-associated protein